MCCFLPSLAPLHTSPHSFTPSQAVASCYEVARFALGVIPRTCCLLIREAFRWRYCLHDDKKWTWNYCKTSAQYVAHLY